MIDTLPRHTLDGDMTGPDDVRARILARPSPEVLARRRQVIDEIRRLRLPIAPLTVVDLRRGARDEEEAGYAGGCCVDC